MSRKDEDLLARLNALKQSSVTLESSRAAPSIDIEVSKPHSIEDRLAERLKGLRSGVISPTADQSKTPAARGLTGPSGTGESSRGEYQDHITHWQENSNDDDRTLEDLLADIGPEEQWKLDPNDPEVISSLLKEAKESLPPNEGGDEDQDYDNEISAENTTDAEDKSEMNERGEDVEADDYVKKILAELEMEKKYGGGEPEPEPGPEPDALHDKSSGADLDLPSTPSNLPQTQSSAEPPSYEDSELEARFSKLGFDLPSTPTAAPSSKSKAAGKAALDKLNQAKAKSDLPVYTDEDIDSWCCICNEDGEVRCLGCDGDIYCQNCWSEGHGTGPGQERGHKAVQYNRKGPAPAAA